VTKRKNENLSEFNNVKDAYFAGKNKSEELVSKASAAGSISGKNLRLYAFAGPGISLVDHFAVGNFMNDALQGRGIVVKGNPETRRSYLYPTDLVSNIFAAAACPNSDIMELGARSHLSMKELAELINVVTGNTGMLQLSGHGEKDEYFPTVDNLAVSQKVSLESAIARWEQWLRCI
jgi:nucleoside-diphosphate-sugar epimerase